MAQNKPTTDEHYIPRCYLKQFTIDGERLYQYDVISKKQTPVPVPITSIGYKRNLYEFQNENGEFIHRNLIEKCFVPYEGIFENVFRSIQAKAINKANLATRSFLIEKEKAFLMLFLTTMILRAPETLQELSETTKDIYNRNISDATAKNLVLQTGLPIYKKLDFKETTLFNAVLGLFEDMAFVIGITEQDVLLTSDKPVLVTGEHTPVKVLDVLLPITPNLILFMKPYANTNRELYNRLIRWNQKNIEAANKKMIRLCHRWIYSKSLLTEQQIKWISKLRK